MRTLFTVCGRDSPLLARFFPDARRRRYSRFMKTRLRLGVIGTGLAAHLLYLPALKTLRHRIEIVACANRTRQKAEHFAKLVGCPLVVDTPEELLDLDQVQAVLISLPIDVQPQYVLRRYTERTLGR